MARETPDEPFGALTQEAAAVLQEQSALVRYATHPLVRLVLGTAPYTGGIGSVLGDVAQRRQEIRLRRFLIDLAREVEENREEVRDRIDREFLATDEFASILESVLDEAARTSDEQKLNILRRFLQAATMRLRPDVSWQELFVKYLGQLSGAHLVILAEFYRTVGRLPASDRLGGIEIPGRVPLRVVEVGKKVHLSDHRLLTIACVDLANTGLLVDWRNLRDGYSGYQESYCLTDNGLLFMRFILHEWADKPGDALRA